MSQDVVGNERQIVVSGCTHSTVGSIVRGAFTLDTQNHGKPTYKKDTQVNGLDVMLYFWDERDGAAFSGWWFGPKVGGDQVWAYHPQNTPTPPKGGWKVPYDGPVDTTFAITAASAAPAAVGNQAWGGAAGGGQLAQQSWGKGGKDKGKGGKDKGKGGKDKGGKDKGKGKGKDWGKGGKGGDWQEQMALQQQLAQQDKMIKDAEAAVKRAEQTAAMSVRRVITKVRGATDENFDELKQELASVLASELENCGSIRDKVREEADTMVQQSAVRLEQARLAKAEAERLRKEMQDKAEALIKEMGDLMAAAEESCQAVKEAGEPLSAEDATFEDVTCAASAVEEASETAKTKLKLCTDFIKDHGNEMTCIKVEGETDVKAEWTKLLGRTNDCAKDIDQTTKSAQANKVKAEKKVEAKTKLKARMSAFEKYDKDKDGRLSKVEVKNYAKGAFDFTIPAESLESIFSKLVEDGAKGVKKELFQRLKVAVGCARERAKDSAIRKEREEKEKQLAEKKANLQEQVAEASSDITKSEEVVKKAEQASIALNIKGKDLPSADMIKMADEVDTALNEAKETVAETKKAVEGIKAEVDDDVKAWLLQETGKLEAKTMRWEPRLSKAASACSTFRELAKGKERGELDVLEKQVVSMIRHHQLEGKLTKEKVFEEFDTDKDGKITESEFVSFFKTCKKDEPKEEPKEEVKTPGKVAPKKEPPTDEEFARVFQQLDEDQEGSITQERFCIFIRQLMKVLAETVLSSGKSIKDKESKTLRRMEVNEVVEVLEGPIEDETAGVMRVRALAMKDNVEGWVTLKGNKGTPYLQDGGFLFKVLKETVMTGSFDLDPPEGETPKKEVNRKLKEGEILEVMEWPKLEEKSNLTRMKCKAKSDGTVGFATTIGNAGTVFIQAM